MCSSDVLSKISRRDLKRWFFVSALVFTLLYVEFVFFSYSCMGPIEGLAIYLNPKGNEVENAVGRLTITDEAHLLIKGQGKFNLKIYDSNGKIVLVRKGRFNGTGFAEIRFQLSPEKFRVDEEYLAVLEVFSEPLPMILKCGKVKIRFTVRRDVTRLGIGFYKNPVTNETIVFAKLTDETGPITGRKIIFEYKCYASNEVFRHLGEAVTDQNGKAEIPLKVNETELIVVKAEFPGDELYEPSATSEIYTNKIDVDLYASYLSGKLGSEANRSKNESVRSRGGLQNQNSLEKHQTIEAKNENILEEKSESLGKISFTTSLGFKVATSSLASKIKISIKPRENSVKIDEDGSSDGNSPRLSDSGFNYNFEQMSLLDFLDRITMDNSPASLLVDVVEILSNPCDLPYVVHKLQIVLSKLSIALIPMIDGDGIVLYRVEVHEVVKKVAKQITETVTEVRSKWVKGTKTVYRKVAKRIRVWQKLVIWVKERKVISYRYWDPLRWKWVTVRQVYHVWVPKVRWKVFWKTIYQTVKETITYWVRVTETVTKTVVKTIYETVKETVKENVNVYRLKVFKGKVVDLKANKEYNLAEWLLSLIGINVKALEDSIKDKENPMGGLASAFVEFMAPFVEFVLTVGDVLREWFATWFKQIAYVFTAKLLAEMYENAWREEMEFAADGGGEYPEEPRVAYYKRRYDEFDLIKSLSPVRRVWTEKDKLGNVMKTWYVAKCTYMMPTIAKIHLLLSGENSLFNVLYTTERLVKLDNGEAVWINCASRSFAYMKDGDKWKIYVEVLENGKTVRREIVKDLGVERRVMLTYYLENGELKAVPTVYLARENIELSSEEAKIVDTAIKKIKESGKSFKVAENKYGSAEIIAVTDLSKVTKELNTKNYNLQTLYCMEQLVNIEETSIENIKKLPESLKYNEKFDPVFTAFVEKLGEAIGDSPPGGGRVVNALHMDFEDESGVRVCSMVDPFYAGRSEVVYINPMIIRWILEGDERGIRILELAGYQKLEKVESDGGIRWSTKFEKGELYGYYHNRWRKELRDPPRGAPRAASLSVFCHDVSVAELYSLLYDVDKNIKIYLGEIDGEKVETNLAELLKLRNKIDSMRTSQFVKSASNEEIKLIRAVTGTNSDLNLRNSMFQVDLGFKVVMEARPPDQRHGYTAILSSFPGRGVIDHLDISVKSYIENKSILGEKGAENAWLAQKISYNLIIYEETIRKLDEKIKELESKATIDPNVEMKINGLEKLKNKIMKAKENAKAYFSKATRESLKNLAGITIRGYLMMNFGMFLMMGGMSLANILIKRYTDFFAWLEENEWAKLLLGGTITTIFIVGLNIDTGWMNKICGKIGAKELAESMAKEAVDGNGLLEKSSFILGMFFGGFGIVMKALKIPFYTSDEIREEIGKLLNSKWNGAGDIWNMIMGFKIPLIDQTVFDILLGLALGGPAEAIGDTIMGTIINKLIAPILNRIAFETIATILENHI